MASEQVYLELEDSSSGTPVIYRAFLDYDDDEQYIGLMIIPSDENQGTLFTLEDKDDGFTIVTTPDEGVYQNETVYLYVNENTNLQGTNQDTPTVFDAMVAGIPGPDESHYYFIVEATNPDLRMSVLDFYNNEGIQFLSASGVNDESKQKWRFRTVGGEYIDLTKASQRIGN